MRQMWRGSPPASASTARMLTSACSNCGAISGEAKRCCASQPTWPATNTIRPASISMPFA
jgi:hypothetical protein